MSLRTSAQPGRDGVVELDQNDESDAEIGADEAERGAQSIAVLSDDDATLDGGPDFGGDVVLDQVVSDGADPAEVEGGSQKEDVEPVSKEGQALAEILGEEGCGKGGEGDGEQESKVNPGKAAVGTGEMVELGLLADPKDAKGEEAH